MNELTKAQKEFDEAIKDRAELVPNGNEWPMDWDVHAINYAEASDEVFVTAMCLVDALEFELAEAQATIRSGNDYMRALEKAEASERRARNECLSTITELTTQLARANAVIERVVAADQPVRDWLMDSMKACTACVDTRGSWRQCSYHEGADDAVDRAFESVERTILEGNGA